MWEMDEVRRALRPPRSCARFTRKELAIDVGARRPSPNRLHSLTGHTQTHSREAERREAGPRDNPDDPNRRDGDISRLLTQRGRGGGGVGCTGGAQTLAGMCSHWANLTNS